MLTEFDFYVGAAILIMISLYKLTFQNFYVQLLQKQAIVKFNDSRTFRDESIVGHELLKTLSNSTSSITVGRNEPI